MSSRNDALFGLIHMTDSVSTMHFIGVCDKLPERDYNGKAFSNGDVIFCKENNVEFIYSPYEGWLELGHVSDSEQKKTFTERPKQHNCRNCGASLFANGRCAYCGTER